MSSAENHLVVFGATSFVGQILSRYLLEQYGVNGALRWAIAGRSKSRLESLREELGDAARDLPLQVVDAADETALGAMCASTRVVISTVGPYAFYGSPLVKVCAEIGTDYCDLTGEVQWISRMIKANEAAAKKSGARIVHCCGFDSIPSDLGVHFLQAEAQKKFGEPCTQVRMMVRSLKGGMSGGTVASLLNAVKESVQNPEVRKLMQNPYAVCPGEGVNGVRQNNVSFEYNADAGSWLAPFVMSAINTRIVHRSNALSGMAYGHKFKYDESTMTGAGTKGRMTAMGMSAGLGGFVAAVALPPSRWLLEKFVLPKPGEGPTPEQQRKGRFDLRFFGTTESGKTIKVKVTGDRDPGYGSTGKMLGEAGVCLAMDLAEARLAGGFWTPATIFGDRLVERLSKNAGLSFSVVE